MDTGGKPQPQSADRIRERFLTKIGIEAPLPPPPGQLPTVRESREPPADGTRHDKDPELSLPLTSCLGGMKPVYEPLKVCLDDDTSDEEGGDHDDDDYFVGIDDEDIEGLFKKRACIHMPPTVAPVTSPAVKLAPVQQPMEAPLPSVVAAGAASAVVSDEGSEASSMATVPSHSSLRNLSRSQQSQESLGSKSQGTKRKRTSRRVSLKTDVAVVPIPRREEYSERVRGRLWSSAAELYQNAARNAVEFASEGWNWRNVTEDEDMLVHDVSGELIHPVHLQNVLQMNAESGAPPMQIPLKPNRPGASLPQVANGPSAVQQFTNAMPP